MNADAIVLFHYAAVANAQRQKRKKKTPSKFVMTTNAQCLYQKENLLTVISVLLCMYFYVTQNNVVFHFKSGFV